MWPSAHAGGQAHLARHVLGPAAMDARDRNLVGGDGDVGGGSYRLRQVVFRPVPGLSPFRTPLDGLFLGSAAAFAGGAVHGVPGECGGAGGAALTARVAVHRDGRLSYLAMVFGCRSGRRDLRADLMTKLGLSYRLRLSLFMSAVALACLSVPALVVAAASDEPVSPAGLSPGPVLLSQARDAAARFAIDRRERRVARGRTDRVSARRRSRSAFKGLGRADAILLARQQFRDLIDAPGFTKIDRPGHRVESYIGLHSARIANAAPGGGDALEVSGEVIQAKDASGQLAPVDATLAPVDGGWAPKNVLDAYRISSSSMAGVRFGDQGFSVAPAGADVTGIDTPGASIAYASVQTDTDAFVRSMADGVEYTWQLRSASSPEELRLHVDLPAGASLAKDAGNRTAILKAGKPIGTISRGRPTFCVGAVVNDISDCDVGLW